MLIHHQEFATGGFVYASTHKAWQGVEILNDVLVTIEIVTIDPLPLPEHIKTFIKELLRYISPAQVWNYCFGIDSMVIMSTSETDQAYGYLPRIQVYANDDSLWPEPGSVVHIEGTWEKRSILWKNVGYIFRVDKVIIDKSYTNFEDLADLGENAEVKIMAIIIKERIHPDNTYHFLSGPKFSVSLKLPEEMQIPNLTLTEIHGVITDKSYKDKKVECTITVDNLRILLADSNAQLQSPDQSKVLAIIDCPVNATITDQHGRTISGDGTNEIPGADMLITKEVKIFYLPADLRYSVDIDAYDTGTFNFTKVSPVGNDISITKFENIPVTSSTKASVEIEPGVTEYTMSIDYNGDGVTDEEKSPDVSETVKQDIYTPEKEWDKTFGGTDWDVALSVQQTSDGGYILAGGTESYGAGSCDFWLVKTDSSGNKQWDKTFGGTNGDVAYSVQQTSGGGYILAGNTNSYGAGLGDFWLVKTDSNGNKQWDKTFGGTDWDVAYSVQQTSGGGYILAGGTELYGAGSGDFWLIKVSGKTTELKVHNLNTGKDFSTIQSAIEDSNTKGGHTIKVDAGTYMPQM